MMLSTFLCSPHVTQSLRLAPLLVAAFFLLQWHYSGHLPLFQSMTMTSHGFGGGNISSDGLNGMMRFGQAGGGRIEEQNLVGARIYRQLLEEWQARGVAPLTMAPGKDGLGNAVKSEADVAGASVTHNGSTSNPCLSQGPPLLVRALIEVPPRPFTEHIGGLHSFLLKSSYRLNNVQFAIIGLSAVAMHEHKEDTREQQSCVWHWADQQRGDISGQVSYFWPGEHHDLMYETQIILCVLERPAEKEEGPSRGGSLYMTIDGGFHQVHREELEDNKREAPIQKAKADHLEDAFKYNLAYCSLPLYGELQGQRLGEWVLYNFHTIGVEFFLINDGGAITPEVYTTVLHTWVQAGVMEVNDIRVQFRYETKQVVLALNDCAFRFRSLARWLLTMDSDEYLHVKPPESMSSLLLKNKDRPFLTFGSLWWSTELCRSSESRAQWPQERMRFHWPHEYCVDMDAHGMPAERCTNYHGHRKYAFRPTQVRSLQCHQPVEALPGGLHVNTSVAHLNHFQGLGKKSLRVCTNVIQEGQSPEWWVEDSFLATAMSHARSRGPPKARREKRPRASKAPRSLFAWRF
eukprot:TRINITY_DN1480_c0_g2_i1.p1 TRINITY_DN1480_c0_g2~~TRINITY_DN1480_c0_g2_i1.p1  ORF type:complete len:575 (-),score=74.04 TRINITY_DN1480_c0_g2_i1:398-2122(-)